MFSVYASGDDSIFSSELLQEEKFSVPISDENPLEVLHIMGYMGMLCPKGVPFLRLEVYKRVGISQVEVYKWVGRNTTKLYKKGLSKYLKEMYTIVWLTSIVVTLDVFLWILFHKFILKV